MSLLDVILLVIIILLTIDNVRVRMADDSNQQKEDMKANGTPGFQGSAFVKPTIARLEPEELVDEEAEDGSD